MGSDTCYSSYPCRIMSSKEQRKVAYVAKRKKPSGDSDEKTGKSVLRATALHVLM